MACRLEGLPRTIKEISSTLGIESKIVGRIYIKINKSLDTNTAAMPILPKHLVPRICSQLKLPSIISDANTICDNLLETGILGGCSPNVSAGAVIYFLCKRAEINVDTNQLCAAIVCDRSVLLNAYQRMLPLSNTLNDALLAAKDLGVNSK